MHDLSAFAELVPLDHGLAVARAGRGQGWTSYARFDPDRIVKLVARLSTDGGKTYPTLLAKRNEDAVLMDFIVPDMPTAQAKIKVIAWDSLGNKSSDVSDKVFTISRY